MLTFDPHSEARERARQLQAQAAAERLHPSTSRRLLAEALRRTARPARLETARHPAQLLAPMRAAVHERYGPPEVLRIRDVPQPEPAENEVLVHVRASTVTRTDCGLRVASPFFVRLFTGLLRPKQTIIGMEFAGEIVAVGGEVEELAPGDRVFGVKRGSNAEYVCVKTSGPIARIPAEMPFEEAAAVADGGCSALSTLRQAGLKPGQRVRRLRRVRLDRHRGRPGRQGPGSARHRRLRPERPRARPLAGRGRGRRLHAGGLRRARRDVRPRLRRRRQELVPPLPPRAEA